MYQGKLITFKIENRNNLIALSLSNVDAKIDDKGILITRKDTGEELGYFQKAYGIDFNEMMNILGFEYIE